jgi:hypothetical protein
MYRRRMLAYVFWHRPRGDVDASDYEEAQRYFHRNLEEVSACFRLRQLPFAEGPGYEDWYLVDDWAALGELNHAAVDPIRGRHHDHAAEMSAAGWGGVYELQRGPVQVPAGTEWLQKPRGVDSEAFLASLPGEVVWRRQMVLGPAPEFCVAVPASPSRQRVWPPD